ncbi:MAG: hypothetical protein ACFFAM_18445 [Promethearchaeota archaeon]
MTMEQLEHIQLTKNIVTTSMNPREVQKLLRSYETQTMSCLILEDELFFVDTLARIDLTKQFRQDMEKRFKKPTTHLLLTHDHWHCAFGMSVFEDVTVAISSAGKSYYRKNLKYGVYEKFKNRIIRNIPDDDKLRELLLEAPLFVPHVGISNIRYFGQNDEVFFKVIGMHTRPSSMIYVKPDKTLFTGGALNTVYGQSIWPLQAIELYREWEKMEIDYVVPGHGFVTDKQYITIIRKYFEELVAKLRELKNQGLTKTQVLKHNDLPEYPGKKQKSWIEGSDFHTKVMNNLIKWWYGQILKEQSDNDLLFIS